MGPEEFWELNRGSGDEDDRNKIIRKANRMMFIDDLEKFPLQPMPLSIDEFECLFGKPTSEDKDIMTQCFIKDYLRIGDSIEGKERIVDKWGLDWISLYLHHNEQQEEYELCSIIKEVYDEGKIILKEWMKNETIT